MKLSHRALLQMNCFSKRALYERNLSPQLSIGGRRKDPSTGRMSQSGNRLGAWTSFRETPLITSLKRGSSEKERHPNCISMVAIAERCPFTAEADKPLDLTRKAKKLAN